MDSTDRDRWTPPRHRSRGVSADLARARARTRHRESTGDRQWPQPAGGEAANADTHLSQGGRSDVPGQSPALARRQDREELDARHGEAGVPSHRRHARRSHRAGGCPTNLEARLDDASRGGAEAPPAHPGDVAVVPGARACRSERRRRGNQRCPPRHVQRPKTPSGATLHGRSRGASRDSRLRGVRQCEAGP